MTGLILGAGEVGTAYYAVLNPVYPETYRLDVRPERADRVPRRRDEDEHLWDVLHVALRYSPKWANIVHAAVKKYRPRIVHVLSTVPPGTCARLGATHSTTRGLHPRLADYIRATPKHIGGPAAAQVAAYFRAAGLTCVEHQEAKTTEIAHILGNAAFALQAVFADEAEALCRHYGVDYYDAVMRYAETHNEGYRKMGMQSKFRPIVWPAGGRLGGHCFAQTAQLVPPELRGPLLERVATYNDAPRTR